MNDSRGLALITGASSGLGAEFARQLAAQGYGLILVARRAERLEALADELRRKHNVSVETFPADLADPADLKRVEQRLATESRLTLLVNNAGFGTRGNFAEADLDRQLEMIQVHVLASVRLTRAALPGLIARKRGAILNVSSLAGFIPRRGSATYGATKAYLNSFSEALGQELQGTGVRVQALCPGFTQTEFHEARNLPGFKRAEIPQMFWMPAEAVVAQSLAALNRDHVIVIPGLRNHLLKFVSQNRLILALLLAWRQLRRRRLARREA